MDWPKIKSVLIIVLMFTNLLLGVTYLQSQMEFEQMREAQLNQVLELMNRQGILIGDVSLSFPKRLNAIDVAYEDHTETDVQRFLGMDYSAENNLYKQGETQVVLSELTLFYNKVVLPDLNLSDHQDAESMMDTKDYAKYAEIVATALGNWNYAKDYQIDQMYEKSGYVVVTAKQIYEDNIMDDSLMTLIIKNDEVLSLTRTWLKINTEKTPNKYDIISVDRALYVTMPKLKADDMIEKIGISYKLNDSSSVVSNLVSGEALPFYRLEISDGTTYYVRAIIEN